MRYVFTILLLVFLPVTKAGASPQPSVRDYAHKLTLERWHSEQEWRELDRIVTPESGWSPCRHYPSTTDCAYQGSNSCGVPQANPCPVAWRGRLWATRYAQVRWLLDYVQRRYRTPHEARATRDARHPHWY